MKLGVKFVLLVPTLFLAEERKGCPWWEASSAQGWGGSQPRGKQDRASGCFLLSHPLPSPHSWSPRWPCILHPLDISSIPAHPPSQLPSPQCSDTDQRPLRVQNHLIENHEVLL